MKIPFMKLPKLPKGFIYENVAPLGEEPEWVMKPEPHDWTKKEELVFGYPIDVLMAKQYK